jgi:hypothetical protein
MKRMMLKDHNDGYRIQMPKKGSIRLISAFGRLEPDAAVQFTRQ